MADPHYVFISASIEAQEFAYSATIHNNNSLFYQIDFYRIAVRRIAIAIFDIQVFQKVLRIILQKKNNYF